MDTRSTTALQDKIILNNIPTAYFLFDESYNAVDCNRAAVNLFAPVGKSGVARKLPCAGNCDNCERDDVEQCPGRLYLIERALHIYPGYAEDRKYIRQVVEKACARALAEGRLKFEHTFSTMSGGIVPCEVTIIPLNYKQGYVYYFRDLRDSRRIREEMKSREAAEEESRAKTRFLARMSHEIRTPMNAVLGITESELNRGGHRAETRESFMRIYSSSSLLLSIINDILDLSKVEAGKMEIITKPYEIASLIMDTVQLNMIYCMDKQIEFNLNIDKQLPLRFTGDELRIKQILNNILSNAFKYTLKGSVSLSAGMENTETGLVLIFTVKDTGQGMNSEQIKVLFAEFSRFNIRNNPDIEGSGLGMTITHQLVSLMGGEMLVESEPGVGSIFTVRIPQQAHGYEIIGEELAESLQSMETTRYRERDVIFYEALPYGRVLIVDDMESNLYVARKLLEPYGLKIEEATNGYEALSKIKYGEEYDIIFMDRMMPGMDGTETVRRVRELGYEGTIVALTANTLGEYPEFFQKSGFDGFISKPIDTRALDAVVLKFVRDKHPEKTSKVNSKQPGNLPSLSAGRLADAVARDIRLALEELDKASFDDVDIQLYINYTHAMKNALNNIGENVLSQMAALLEQAARKECLPDVRALSPGFILRLKELLESLTTSEENHIKDEDTPFLKEQMENLRLACTNFNVTDAWKILDELEHKPWTKETKALINKFTDYLIGGYFDEAAELARNIAEKE